MDFLVFLYGPFMDFLVFFVWTYHGLFSVLVVQVPSNRQDHLVDLAVIDTAPAIIHTQGHLLGQVIYHTLWVVGC